MEPHVRPAPDDPAWPAFPTLPIVTPGPPPLTQREKYGGLFWLGLAGLVVLVAMVIWFSWGVWSLRAVWGEIYTLHDSRRRDVDRIQAAFALSRDPRVNQRQYWEMSLRRPLPGLARYLLAEALTAEAAAADPRNYALTVARSPEWPDWLRLLLLRPMALAAIQGVEFPRDPLAVLSRHDDPIIALWADFILASNRRDPSDTALQALVRACARGGNERALACFLLRATRLAGHPREQRAALEEATQWIRGHHRVSAALWEGWGVEGNRLVPQPASKLH